MKSSWKQGAMRKWNVDSYEAHCSEDGKSLMERFIKKINPQSFKNKTGTQEVYYITQEGRHSRVCMVCWVGRWGSTSGYGRLVRRPLLLSAQCSCDTLSPLDTPRPLHYPALRCPSTHTDTHKHALKKINAPVALNINCNSQSWETSYNYRHKALDFSKRDISWNDTLLLERTRAGTKGRGECREVTFFLWHTLHLPISAQADGWDRKGEKMGN